MLKPEDIAPDVQGFDFYLDAFRELSTCRAGGFGVTPIPFMAIVEYAKIYGIDEDEFQEFLDIIRRMDSEFIKLENESSKKKTNNGGTTGKRNKGSR